MVLFPFPCAASSLNLDSIFQHSSWYKAGIYIRYSVLLTVIWFFWLGFIFSAWNIVYLKQICDKAKLPGKLNTAKHSDTSESKYHVTKWKTVPSALLGWSCYAEHRLTAWTQRYSHTAARVPRKAEPNISKLQNPWHPQSSIHLISILRIYCAGFSFRNSPNNKKAGTTVLLWRSLTQSWKPLLQTPFHRKIWRTPVNPSQLSYTWTNLMRIT